MKLIRVFARYVEDITKIISTSGEVAPPALGFQRLWFTLTVAAPVLKRLLFPKFFDSEMG
jgi:hypothetical protein